MSIEINRDVHSDGARARMSDVAKLKDFFLFDKALSKTVDCSLLQTDNLSFKRLPHSKSTLSHQDYHWQKFAIMEYFPLFSACIATLLCIGLVPKANWNTENYAKYVLCSVYLVCLSSLKVQKVKYVSEGCSAALVVISIIQMETVFGHKQCLVSYLTFLVAYRIMFYKSFFDNFAICVSYTINVGAVFKSQFWYIASNVLIWVYFLVTLLLLYVIKRAYFRLWEHVRIMMILKEKIIQERNIGEALVAAHIPEDILTTLLFQSTLPVEDRSLLRRTPSEIEVVFEGTKGGVAQSPPVNGQEATINTDELLRIARNLELMPSYSDAQLSLPQLNCVQGFDRRECAVVAIGFDSAGDAWAQGNQALHELLDKLAATHRITCVRKFGSVWLGCVGFFRTWESASVNSHEALLFACEASYLVGKFASRTTYAVDCGTITGGYLNSLNFDLFGQEVRWMLMVLELKLYGKVIVGEAAQKAIHAFKRAAPRAVGIKTAELTVPIPWDTSNGITVHHIENIDDVIEVGALSHTDHTAPAAVAAAAAAPLQDPREAEVDEDISPPSSSPLPPTKIEPTVDAERPKRAAEPINWHTLQALLNQRELPACEFHVHPSPYVVQGLWTAGNKRPTFDQEIGEEFLLSTMDRFQLSVTDPILDKLSVQDLFDAHAQAERKLIEGVRKMCFPTQWRYCWLSSCYTEADGRDEYQSLMIYAHRFRSEWYVGPLTALFGEVLVDWCSRQLFAASRSKPSTPVANNDMENHQPLNGAAPLKLKKKRRRSANSPASNYHPSRVAPIAEAENEDSPIFESESNKSEPLGDTDTKNLLSSIVAPAASAAVPSTPPSAEAGPQSGPLTSPPPPSPSTSKAAEQPASSVRESLRSWEKYAGDTRLFFYDERWNGLVTLLFFVVQLYALDSSMIVPDQGRYPSIFLFLVVCIAGLLLLIERRYDPYTRYVIIFLTMACAFVMPDMSRCKHSSYQNNGPTDEYGDLGGDVHVNLLLLPLIPIHMRQNSGFSIINIILLRLTQGINTIVFDGHCSKATFGRYPVLALSFLWMLYYWALQFTVYASYIIEHKLLTEAVRNYRKQKANTRALLHAFAPSVPNSKTCQLFVPKSYRQCAVAALHIKASDQLAQFLEPKDFSLILSKIYSVIDKCIAECGMLSVTHFSGVYIAAACRDSAWDSVESLRFPDSHTARTVVLLRRVRTKLAALSRELKFSIQLGIGIDQGPVQLGFLGQNRFCYDIAGPARDLAVAMSSFHGSGAFANEAFDSDIRKMQAPEDLIRDVTGLLEPSRSNGSRWLRIDGSFNGIQLEDFKYLCLLGQGGYGSVHLLAEKHTGVPYAIKAIELKQESKLSKMIERECSILQMIQHPNVVNLKYSFRNHNRLYLVMSYIRGGNLKQVIDRDNLDLAHILPWFAELVLAVEYLHCMGIIHRDVKPANCMIGTDGHLKLADFGLSKVVIPDKEIATLSREAATQASILGLSYEAFQKVRKFFPLKIDAAHREDAVEATMHRTIRVLLITMDDDKADSTLLFINTTVEINIADYDIDSDTICSSNFEAIFIDGDYYVEDGVEFVQHFCSMLLNSIPVLLIAKNEDLRQRGLKAGARACSRLPLEALNEDTFDVLFGPEPDHLFADPLKHCLLDIVQFQEEKSPAGGVQDSPGVSLHVSRSRTADASVVQQSNKVKSMTNNIVAVESRSHSLVGTLHFIAPEVIKLRKYGKAVDWWACGVTFYQCVTRKHLFKGEDKKVVLESIMNGPIDLSLLQPHGDAIVSLVKGLLCRDIKKRLGSQSIEVIKAHKAFEKIDWATVSTGNPAHRPAQFVNRKFRAEDKDLFYGPRGGHFDLHREQLDDRSTASMQKYLLNKKRAKMRGESNSRGSGSLANKPTSDSNRVVNNRAKHDKDATSTSRNKSRSRNNSKGSSSLELVVESLQEVHEEL